MKIDRKISDITERMKGFTPFQRAVWLACMSIPKGETRSYKWIAERIGRPGAFRAVGTALARNPFAPEVPCHRVIASDGTIGGYSGPGGTRGKLKLLLREKDAAKDGRRPGKNAAAGGSQPPRHRP